MRNGSLNSKFLLHEFHLIDHRHDNINSSFFATLQKPASLAWFQWVKVIVVYWLYKGLICFISGDFTAKSCYITEVHCYF